MAIEYNKTITGKEVNEINSALLEIQERLTALYDKMPATYDWFELFYLEKKVKAVRAEVVDYALDALARQYGD